jgi:outer membrane protein insertion porin family
MGEMKENGYLPLNEKFYLGGLGSVRGYNYSSISPKNSDGDEIGGKFMMINSIEISMPVSLKKKMWLSGFIDNGKIGEDSLDISRSSYGVSFDWITLVGPLNFTWAWAINPKPDDDLRKFEFSIGTGF